MKNLYIRAVSFGACIALALGFAGCGTTATTTAVNSDAVLIQTVNGALAAWAAYVNAGKATRSQVDTVSNAYNVYFNSQVVASNASYLYVISPTTNSSQVVSLTLAAALASQTNLVAIINQLSK